MYNTFKAIMDRVLALIGLIILFLPLLIVAIVIRIDSKGPAVFKQERVGKNQKTFMCYKFRTMISTNIETTASNPIVKDDNANVTRVGRVIRKLKIDEFMQLVNVLRGEMSLIGPRPFMPVHVEGYEPWEKQKFDVKPGMSGLSQVRGNVYLSGLERSYYDVMYTKTVGFKTDAEILFKTVGVILIGEKRYIKHVPDEEIERLRKEYNDGHRANSAK